MIDFEQQSVRIHGHCHFCLFVCRAPTGRGANARLVDASGCPALAWTRDFKGITAQTVDSPSPDAVVQAALARERAKQNAQQREDCDDGDGGDDDDMGDGSAGAGKQENASSTRLARLHAAGLANEVVSDDEDEDEDE